MRVFAVALLSLLSIVATSSSLHAQQMTMERQVGAGYELLVANTNIIVKPLKSADHFFYNPVTGRVVVGLTNHPQRSGFNGETIAPGDCWGTFDSGIVGAKMQVGDLDGDGLANDILLYRFSDGKMRQFAVTLQLFPGCDTSDSW